MKMLGGLLISQGKMVLPLCQPLLREWISSTMQNHHFSSVSRPFPYVPNIDEQITLI